MLKLLIVFFILFFIVLGYIIYIKEKLCLCNGPQIYPECSKDKNIFDMNDSPYYKNSELQAQKPPRELIMPYDVFPGDKNSYVSNKCSISSMLL